MSSASEGAKSVRRHSHSLGLSGPLEQMLWSVLVVSGDSMGRGTAKREAARREPHGVEKEEAHKREGERKN